MSNALNSKETVEFLISHEDFLILTHDNPDGDTLGSGFALCYALRSLGKNANLLYEELPEKFEYLGVEYKEQNFTPKTIVAVDIASLNMLGEKTKQYEDKIDLCIDHHESNSEYATNLYLDAVAAANCENIYNVICDMGVKITTLIATCLYTGIATDTGCFKFSNVTSNTHIFAGALMSYGVDIATINFKLFEEKTQGQMMAETMIVESLDYHSGGHLAMCAITNEIMQKTGIKESDFDAMVGIPRRIKGVDIGVTFKQRNDGYKVSFRTSERVNASDLAANFGGGGHKRAAGCFISGDLDFAKSEVIKVCEPVLKELI